VISIAKNESVPIHENNDSSDDEVKESDSRDKPLYVKVSDETRSIIDNYKKDGLTISNLIKEAINLYHDFNTISPEAKAIVDKYKNPEAPTITFMEKALKFYDEQKNVDRDLWVRAREEMKMMLIGKTTFNQLIAAAEAPKESLDKPFKKNVAIDLILWYTGKPLNYLTIEEIIETIRKIWVVANYFYMIDVKKVAEDQYHILF